MMKFPWKLVLTVAALTIVSITGCSLSPQVPDDDPWGTVEVRRQQTIRIGVASATTDEAISAVSIDVVRGVQLAINDHGRVRGFEVEVVQTAAQCSEDGGRSAAVELASDDSIVVVIGPVCSLACQGAVSVLDDEHLTAVSPSCGAPGLTDQSLHNEAFLRTIYEDRSEGRAAAEFAYVELGVRHAALFGDGSIETAGYLDAFENTFVEYGGTIAMTQHIEVGQNNFRTYLNAVDVAGADVIYAPLLPHDAANLTVQKVGTDVADIPIVGSRRYQNTVYLEEAGNAADGVYAPGPYLTGESLETLASQYEAQFGEQPATQEFVFAYDAAQIILDAIDQIAESRFGGSLFIGKQSLREAIYRTTTFEAMTGSLTCSSFGDCSAAGVGIYQFASNDWSLVYVP